MRSQRRYLLLDTIARTRRSTVFHAIDQLLAREVALKVQHDSDDETVWRVIAEAQAMARFDDPNIVRVHDFGRHEGWLYLVMELCDENVETWRRGRPWADVLDQLVEAGRGLAAVHAAGLVHADVKPENIFVKDGAAKIGDFGLVTSPGWSTRISGTLGYIAPEVADGRQSAASDVFAFACTVWACLVGRPPFGEPPPGADTSAGALVLVERARAGAFGELDRAAAPPPRAIIAALRRALQPDPERRPALDGLLAQLEALRSAGALGRWVWTLRLDAR
ncbi:serine/threonine-protein kinase [Enhygromyxa salina]|nr:serine/threonine-protein kinase [Enhygromyxa salina]